VATYSVKKPVWSWFGSATRARPKSQIYRHIDVVDSKVVIDLNDHSFHANTETFPRI